MENAIYLLSIQMSHQCLTLFKRGQEQVEHVVGLFAVFRYIGKFDSGIVRPTFEVLAIVLSDPLPLSLNDLARFQLGVEERRENI